MSLPTSGLEYLKMCLSRSDGFTEMLTELVFSVGNLGKIVFPRFFCLLEHFKDGTVEL